MGAQMFRDTSSNASANLDVDEQTVRGALVYHFWGQAAAATVVSPQRLS